MDALEPETPQDIAARIIGHIDGMLLTLERLTEAVRLLNELDTIRASDIDTLSARIESLTRVVASDVEHSKRAAS